MLEVPTYHKESISSYLKSKFFMSYRLSAISNPALIQYVLANNEPIFIYSLIWVITGLGLNLLFGL